MDSAVNLSETDIAHIAEEIESMGDAEKRELVNRLTVLLLHLLKWRYQPTRRSALRRAVNRDRLCLRTDSSGPPLLDALARRIFAEPRTAEKPLPMTDAAKDDPGLCRCRDR